MKDPGLTEDLTGIQLALLLRREFPQLDESSFDEDVASFTAGEPPSRCAVLSAFSWQFNDWVRQRDAEPVRRALQLVDQLLRDTPPVPKFGIGETVGDQFHNSLLACFVENVMDTTAAFQSLVLPNLGPEVRQHLEGHNPYMLDPDLWGAT